MSKTEKNIYWGSYTSWELKKFVEKDPVLIIPVGAYEQHGRHLPLDTDTHIGLEIAKHTIRSADYPCALLPPVWSGVSEHHMNFCGTITLSHTTLNLIVHDIARSLYRHGVKKIIVFNSHGGNIAALKTAVETIGSSLELEIILITYWDLIKDLVCRERKSDLGGISHGGELETSLKLYFNEEHVRKDKITAHLVRGNSYFSPEMFLSSKISRYAPFEQLTSDGHIGDPTKANPEFGRMIFEEVTHELSKIIMLFGEGELWKT